MPFFVNHSRFYGNYMQFMRAFFGAYFSEIEIPFVLISTFFMSCCDIHAYLIFVHFADSAQTEYCSTFHYPFVCVSQASHISHIYRVVFLTGPP